MNQHVWRIVENASGFGVDWAESYCSVCLKCAYDVPSLIACEGAAGEVATEFVCVLGEEL